MKSFLSVLTSAALFAFVTGCGEQPAEAPPAQPEPHTAAEHHHHGDAPHGGTIADWGGGAYHVEFTVDHDQQQATVYILGSDAKTAAPIATDKLDLSINEPAFQVELTAQPLEGEAAGTSSRFVGQHEQLGKVQEFSGTITGVVDGTPYAGDFDEGHAHDHAHDHDHAH